MEAAKRQQLKWFQRASHIFVSSALCCLPPFYTTAAEDQGLDIRLANQTQFFFFWVLDWCLPILNLTCCCCLQAQPATETSEAAATSRVREMELQLSLLQADLDAATERLAANDSTIKMFQEVAKASESAHSELQVRQGVEESRRARLLVWALVQLTSAHSNLYAAMFMSFCS